MNIVGVSFILYNTSTVVFECDVIKDYNGDEFARWEIRVPCVFGGTKTADWTRNETRSLGQPEFPKSRKYLRTLRQDRFTSWLIFFLQLNIQLSSNFVSLCK